MNSMWITIVQLIIQKIFPQKISDAILRKIHETRYIIDQYRGKTVFRVLKTLLFILFFPILLIWNILTFITKTLVAWILPEIQLRRLKMTKGDMGYALNEYRLDKQVRGFTPAEAFDHLKYHLEFFWNSRERTVSYGNRNPDKTFLVIRPYYWSTNHWAYVRTHLLSQYYIALQSLEYAEKHGWIPIVDWENYKVPHSESIPIHGTKNAWEYYFEQPSQYTLKEVYQSKHVILSYQNFPWYEGMSIPHFLLFGDVNLFVEQLAKILPNYAKKVPFNQFTMDYFRQAKEKVFPKGKRILGVAARTSYTKVIKANKELECILNSMPDRKVADVEILIKIVRKHMKKWRADYIFFTNEEEENVVQMKREFQDKLLIYPRTRYKNISEIGRESEKEACDPLECDPLYADGNRYQTNLDYLTEMYLLSQCDMLICSLVGGTKAAIIWNEGRYEKMEVIDLGTYRG